MELKTSRDIFLLSVGDIIKKKNLYDLIQYSKVLDSSYWGGVEMQINNTPQQGINWVGKPPVCHAIIIKAKPGTYEENGWVDEEKMTYRYSFKAKNGEISYKEKANALLINQPQYQYPILLLVESSDQHSWEYQGIFFVSEIEKKYVVLERGYSSSRIVPQEEVIYQEGDRKYVTHLMMERNRDVVKVLKENSPLICDICHVNFPKRYGVEYIEAHHKIPITTYSSSHIIKPEDFVLLCPNCHSAVHVYMRKDGFEYSKIKEEICKKVWSA